MISQLQLQDIDLWEAWIEYDQYHSRHFGTLYVMGEVMTDKKQDHPFFIKKAQPAGSRQLVLTLAPEIPSGRARMKEVLYSEPIRDLSQYSSILIFVGDELVARIEDIEVLI